MKGKIILSLLCASFLIACNGKPKTPTYTITIEETQHFTPSKSSFTFVENDFTPIVIPYEIENAFVVTKVSADVKESYCDFDNEKKEITITPMANTNINVTINVTSIKEVSYVTIINPPKDHFTPAKTSIPFAHGDYTPIVFPYTVDKYCSVFAKVTSGRASCATKTEEKEIIVVPNEDNDILISVNVSELYRKIRFDAKEGELAPSAEEYIDVPFNHNWGGFVESGKQIAVYQDYGFKGWTFESETSLGSDVIPFDYRVPDTVPDVAYAVYEHKVNLTSNSLAVEKEVYETIDNETVLKVYFRLKGDKRYEFPTQKQAFTLTNSDGTSVQTFDYEPTSATVLMPYIEVKLSKLNTGSFNIAVEDYQPEYSWSFMGDKIIADHLHDRPKKYEDFKFNMTIVQDPGHQNVYYIPYDIMVTIGGQRMASNAYKIEVEDDTRQKATVTIYKEYVLEDIDVKAFAAYERAYRYQISGYGINLKEGDKDVSSYIEGYHYYDENKLEVTLTTQGAYSMITTDNVVIKVNDRDWYDYDAFSVAYPGIVEFEFGTTNKLTINPIEYESGGIATLSFHLISENYSVFENASWGELKEMCSAPAGYMERMFDVGETKDVEINDIKYSLRIIGINADVIQGDTKAALTIEFSNVIANDDGSTHEDELCEYFRSSYDGETYDNYLSGTFLKKMPTAMTDCIKTVQKKIYSCDSPFHKTISRKVFALSFEELGFSSTERKYEEGDAYEYYNKATNDKRIKTNIDEEEVSYWTRSISQGSNLGLGINIKTDGDYDRPDKEEKYAYMAAFCI